MITQRIAAGLTVLESTAAPIEEIALSVGFDSPVTFRHHFTRATRTSPSAYRRAFRVPA
ncbi:helix-turn-helix domain-containing protein [Streptosporangium canum]|uniref:helix-turn-helix domain-containing protein n=1 Tax=Streptosporangium canum TaxID=324952 RepID=UPI00344AE339